MDEQRTKFIEQKLNEYKNQGIQDTKKVVKKTKAATKKLKQSAR